MKENTSAGISGLHFGHMKTCAMDKTLCDFEAALCHIPFTTSYSPDKWRTNVSVMIKKKEGIERVDKLRTIALLEVDFNFNNKLLGKTTLMHAEQNDLIAKEQCSSRPVKSAIDQLNPPRAVSEIFCFEC